MKKILIRCICIIAACATLAMSAGCSLTKTTVSSEIDETVSYVSGDKNSNTGASSGSADASSDNKGGAGNVVSGSGDNTVHNAGEINNSSEEKLKGTLELQIFVGGYGSECWEYAISEFQKLQPNLEINAHLDTNVNAQMKTRWAKDNPPDFVLLDGSNMPASTWMSENKMRDLSSLYKNGKVYGTSTPISSQLKSGLVSTYKNTGKIYEMPVLLSTWFATRA